QHPRARGLMGAISFRRPEHRDQAIAVARERHRTLFLPSGPDSRRFRPPLTVQAPEIGEAVQALRKTPAERDAQSTPDLPPRSDGWPPQGRPERSPGPRRPVPTPAP